MNRFWKTFWKTIVIIFTVIGFVSFFMVVFNKAYFNTSLEINTDLASDFGTFFGGYVGTIFSILSVILLIYTINIQNTDKRKDEVKNNFFRMLDYHNENVKQLKVGHIDTDKKEDSEGRRAFVIFRIQMYKLINIVLEVNKENNYNLSIEDIIGISYMFFYYGLNKDWKEFIVENIETYPKHSEIAQKTLEKINLNPKLKLGRTNQTSLSSYFRNMYNAIKLVDESKILSDTEKKDLIKIYRAQLSNQELYILFTNLMSKFGKKWKDKGYIIKYEFIKNLPRGYCEECDPKTFFPMTYEYEEV